jgi:ethanolamine ammonia-lyase small subunit
MADRPNDQLAASDLSKLIQKIRARTPARLLAGRSGGSYRTSTQLELREAHAAARDAVLVELNLEKHFDAAFIRQRNLFEVFTQAVSKQEYLLRPDMGRQFSSASREEILKQCSGNNDLQIVIGDGLSVTAVVSQVSPLLEHLIEGAKGRGWSVGQSFVIQHCRVGVLNEIGELLSPRVAVLLIGERPGLATAESLSAYLAYRPNKTHTDADRNLISNIHRRGVDLHQASERILKLAASMMAAQTSGCQLREEMPELDKTGANELS